MLMAAVEPVISHANSDRLHKRNRLAGSVLRMHSSGRREGPVLAQLTPSAEDRFLALPSVHGADL
jgi:hypothetical protein